MKYTELLYEYHEGRPHNYGRQSLPIGWFSRYDLNFEYIAADKEVRDRIVQLFWRRPMDWGGDFGCMTVEGLDFFKSLYILRGRNASWRVNPW